MKQKVAFGSGSNKETQFLHRDISCPFVNKDQYEASTLSDNYKSLSQSLGGANTSRLLQYNAPASTTHQVIARKYRSTHGKLVKPGSL